MAQRPRSVLSDGSSTPGKRTLAIDVGGTGLKASVLDARGKMLADPVRVATPYPCPPSVLVEALVTLVQPLPAFDRVSVGFPGVVRHGEVITAPHFGNAVWRGFAFADALAARFAQPVRLLNDADMQGLADSRQQDLQRIPWRQGAQEDWEQEMEWSGATHDRNSAHIDEL